MRKHFTRFFSAGNLPLLTLVFVVVLLAGIGAWLSQTVERNLLRDDGEDTATAWADALLKSNGEIPQIVAGVAPSPRAQQAFADASHSGDVYRYRIWDESGNLVLASERLPSDAASTSLADRRGAAFASRVLSGETVTESHTGVSPQDPARFVVSYLPIRKDGRTIAVFEVFLDQTADYALYRGSLRVTEWIIVIAVLLAGGLPCAMVYWEMRANRKAQAETIYMAEHDSLTGLYNRDRLREAAVTALAWGKSNKQCVAALLLDLDRFKEINDSMGHATGDELLRLFALRLRAAVREQDTVARLGGDEFVILQVGLPQPVGATALTERLMKSLREPYEIGALRVSCEPSIGVAVAPQDAEEWDRLLQHANAALYRAKDDERNPVCFFHQGMDAVARERRALEQEMRVAVDARTFRLMYQPLFSLRDNRLVGFEALLRWPESSETHSPSKFIPVAEETGLIVPLGAWALKEACTAAAHWPQPLKIAVNLSAVQFHRGDVVADVVEALAVSGLGPSRLELEVTEGVWIQDTDVALDALQRLRALGVSIALDDFGTGYSSLSYLWRFPFDKVKIDASFVRQLKRDRKAAAIAKSIIALGRTLQLRVTAEGIETAAQARALAEAGCDEGQGFLLGRPLTPHDAEKFMHSHACRFDEARFSDRSEGRRDEQHQALLSAE